MKRSKFNLSYHNLLSCNMGQLVPIGLTEVLPGDSIQQATSMLMRVTPQQAPVMHPVHARIHHFFVPFRLIWDDWEDFITGGPDNDDASVFPTKSFASGAPDVGDLADYLGVPPDVAAVKEVSALPFRAYALIWNEFYRDQDLQDPLTIDTTSGADTTTNIALQNVNWEKDYFTSSRPWPQKGPDITVPLGGTAPIYGSAGVPISFKSTGTGTVRNFYGDNGDVSVKNTGLALPGTETWGLNTTGNTGMHADLGSSSVIDINDLRTALALQRFAEHRARYGSRYTEYLRYLGVNSSDARLQRPEYLGGGKQTIQFSEVLQSSPTTDGDDTEGVGNLKGHGIGAMRSNRYRRFFEEHGYIVSLLSVRPKTIYTQGLARTWNRRTKEDFFQKELQMIGQQEVYNKEWYLGHASPDAVFGYQDRYDEYRRSESRVSGEFRTTELDFWHMGRIFTGGTGTLNSDFVKCVPTDRIYAVTTNDVLWIMVHHSMQARRLLQQTGKSATF